MAVVRSPLLSGFVLAFGLFFVSCTLIFVLSTLDRIAFGPTGAPPDPRMIANEAQVRSFAEWLSHLEGAHKRWTTVYLPLFVLIIGAAAGRLSTDWSWTWLVAVFAISPVLVMVVASYGIAPLGVCMALVYAFLAASGATFLAWSRRRRGKL
jgi:Flp pilus assembly protein TadB